MGFGERSRELHHLVLHAKMHKSNTKHANSRRPHEHDRFRSEDEMKVDPHREDRRHHQGIHHHDHTHDMDELGMMDRSRDILHTVIHHKMAHHNKHGHSLGKPEALRGPDGSVHRPHGPKQQEQQRIILEEEAAQLARLFTSGEAIWLIHALIMLVCVLCLLLAWRSLGHSAMRLVVPAERRFSIGA
jgi:hypothetical protein